MTNIFCKVEGCRSSIEASENAGYLCRKHVPDTINTDLTFQDTAFDPALGSGSDPKFYERGGGFVTRGQRSFHGKLNGQSEEDGTPRGGKPRTFSKASLIKKAEAELAEHPNAKEILAIINEDIRDQNSGGRQDE